MIWEKYYKYNILWKFLRYGKNFKGFSWGIMGRVSNAQKPEIFVEYLNISTISYPNLEKSAELFTLQFWACHCFYQTLSISQIQNELSLARFGIVLSKAFVYCLDKKKQMKRVITEFAPRLKSRFDSIEVITTTYNKVSSKLRSVEKMENQ